MGGQARLSIPGSKASGDLRPFRLPFAQIHEIQPGLDSKPATACRLSTGYACGVIDPVSLRPADELYKSFCVISEDRKYLAGASGIKIADKEHPLP